MGGFRLKVPGVVQSESPSKSPRMTRQEALEIAREVIDGRSRSLVQAARDLADYLIEVEASEQVATVPPFPSSEPT